MDHSLLFAYAHTQYFDFIIFMEEKGGIIFSTFFKRNLKVAQDVTLQVYFYYNM